MRILYCFIRYLIIYKMFKNEFIFHIISTIFEKIDFSNRFVALMQLCQHHQILE